MILTLENLSKSFKNGNKNAEIFEGVNAQIKEGQFTNIIGPSGCGKSTLLRVIAGLIKPSKGKVSWDKKREIGFVFQDFALFPYLKVSENIEFGLKMAGEKEEKRKKITEELIAEMGLSGFENKHPKELSGGMKQRVGIARALAIEPDVLLLDEPFSALDELTAEDLRKLLLDLWSKRNITIIMVTHLIAEALALGDEIIVMSGKPGRVREIVKNTLGRPRNLRSQSFFEMEDKLKNLIKD